MTSSPASEPAAQAALPTVADVRDAAGRLAGQAVVTPLLEADRLNDALGGRLLIKAEPLQRTGSFKFRGAYNHVSRLKGTGVCVVAYSSGNHAQAVAAAARISGIEATILMPSDAPRVKIDGTRSQGADVVLYDRATGDREAIAAQISEEKGARLVKPYDDPFVIAGQGTAGLEIAAQCKALALTPDAVVVPAGGGGLTAGCSLALAAELPDTALYTAEPEAFDDHARSLVAGERLSVADKSAKSICDALMAPMPGALTFAINHTHVRAGLRASDDAVLGAMATAFRHFKLVIEPGGAIALAAVLTGAIDIRGRSIVVIASGGNVDADIFQQALERGP